MLRVPKGPLRAGSVGPKIPTTGTSQRRRQMHGAGIAADEQTRATGERDQLGKRTGEGFGRAVAGGFHCVREFFFSGAEVDQRFQTDLPTIALRPARSVRPAIASLPNRRPD